MKLKKGRKVLANNKGFTLIEVLIALFIVSGVFVTILSSFSYHIDIFTGKKDELRVVLVAKEKLFLYKNGKLKELTGDDNGIKYKITVSDGDFGLKKIISRAYTKKESVELLDYVK